MKAIGFLIWLVAFPASATAVLSQVDFPSQLVSGSNWVNAGLGGIAVALIGLIGYLLKLGVVERKEGIKQQAVHTQQLVNVIKENNEVIGGNTRAIESVCRQSESLIGKMDNVRDRLLSRPCLMEKP